MTARRAASHGARSSSVSGVPWRIFSTFAAGCTSSASTNRHPVAADSARPMVVLPEPDGPIRMMIIVREGAYSLFVPPGQYRIAAITGFEADSVGFPVLDETTMRQIEPITDAVSVLALREIPR